MIVDIFRRSNGFWSVGVDDCDTIEEKQTNISCVPRSNSIRFQNGGKKEFQLTGY